MNFGQITQGLRADVLAQAAGKGVNVTQLLEAGVSFADIMLMIVQNQQGMADMSDMPIVQENLQFPQSNVMTENSEENNKLPFINEFQNMSEAIPMLNIQNVNDASEVLDIQKNKIENSDVVQNIPNVMEKSLVQDTEQNFEYVENNTVAEEQDVVYNQNDAAEIHNTLDVTSTHTVQNVQENTNIQQIKEQKSEHYNVINNTYNVEESVVQSIKQDSVHHEQEKVENLVKHGVQQNFVKDVSEMLQTSNIQNVVDFNEVNETSEIVNQILNKNNLYNRITPTNDIRYANELHNIFNLKSEQMKTADFSEVQSNTTDLHGVMHDTAAVQKLADVLGVISPELLKTSENTASYKNNTFMNDLLSGIKTESEIRDSFDFSESILKVDPLQLAGLLDFIGTGNSIPMVSDISKNEILKSFEAVDNVKLKNPMMDKLLFNPEEMIKSGEMEIVSYISAEKNSQQSTSHQNDQQTTDSETIDFARTMKSAKETVTTEIADDNAKFSGLSATMINSNPDEFAHKIDISFDRAYAELEMNKAKYGTPDEQMYKGISENLEKGRSEFTVKLRPEGLGEILVKLVSEDGSKAVLSLVASSEKTAELLNRDLATLQTSLNQHNVEIENNSVKTVETVMHAETSSFEQYNERRQDEAQQQNHFRQIKNKLGNISDRNVLFEAETEAVTINTSDSALNIKI